MPTSVECALPTSNRRMLFWTTQLDACGTYAGCDSDCAIPSLKYIDTPDGRTFATNDWLKSLVTNILNTKGRLPADQCGTTPLAVGGHWSESYREDGQRSGTLIWSMAQRPVSRIQEAVKLLNVQLQADLNKLVTMGVASKVEVETTYKGSNRVAATVTVIGPHAGTNIINLTTERIANEWVWR